MVNNLVYWLDLQKIVRIQVKTVINQFLTGTIYNHTNQEKYNCTSSRSIYICQSLDVTRCSIRFRLHLNIYEMLINIKKCVRRKSFISDLIYNLDIRFCMLKLNMKI